MYCTRPAHSKTTIPVLMATNVGNLNSIRLNETIRRRRTLPIGFFFLLLSPPSADRRRSPSPLPSWSRPPTRGRERNITTVGRTDVPYAPRCASFRNHHHRVSPEQSAPYYTTEIKIKVCIVFFLLLYCRSRARVPSKRLTRFIIVRSSRVFITVLITAGSYTDRPSFLRRYTRGEQSLNV